MAHGTQLLKQDQYWLFDATTASLSCMIVGVVVIGIIDVAASPSLMLLSASSSLMLSSASSSLMLLSASLSRMLLSASSLPSAASLISASSASLASLMAEELVAVVAEAVAVVVAGRRWYKSETI